MMVEEMIEGAIAVGRLRNSTVIVVPDVGLKWKLMKQLLMLRLASPSLRADGMKDSCRYWDARVVIEKLWSMSELKMPARRALI